MTSHTRYSGISLTLLRKYRTVLVRRSDAEGNMSWSAEVAGAPGVRATGATRTEALNRVQAILASWGDAGPRRAWPRGSSKRSEDAAAA